MADVRPFRGLRFGLPKAGSLDDLVAPPYDVVSPAMQKDLYGRSPYNVIRLELGTESAEDSDSDSRYTRAATLLDEWVAEGILVQDGEPTIYLINHEFEYQGQRVHRRELTVALRLEDWASGVVRPHENTASGPKADRLALMHATKANLSPLLLMSDDRTGRLGKILDTIEAAALTAQASTPEKGSFSVWASQDDEVISAISEVLKGLPLYMADGHHRYETALEYCREVGAQRGTASEDPAAFVLASIVDVSDDGLLSLPYHRVVSGTTVEGRTKMLAGARQALGVESIALGGRSATEIAAVFEERQQSSEAPLFGVVGLEDDMLTLLAIQDSSTVQGVMPEGRSGTWCSLTPTVFGEFLLNELVGLSQPEAEAAGKLGYTGDAAEAVEQVQNGSADLAFLLSEVSFADLKGVADADERLPRKSTYFYPKLATGLVMKSLSGAL